MNPVIETNFPDLPLFKKGKVREVYDLGENLLIVASDRISAFDYIMPQPVPGKGIILNKIAEFWFKHTEHIIPNHFITSEIDKYPEICHKYADILNGRSMLVQKTRPLPIEFVVRGYITGSAWKEYLAHQSVCGIQLPEGLQEFDQLPNPIFTPATKNDLGHDENITFEQMKNIIDESLSLKLRHISIELYKYAHDFLWEKGLILADTKFEFGTGSQGEIILIDEALTPDSSRFWLKDDYLSGNTPINFDKQVLRDYLLNCGWDRNSNPPDLPEEIIEKTLARYKDALFLITGEKC
jgi:phosphoribosylaminoimidazole-succinocarboxamide synthase (EC 6.3.2.6)